MNILDHYDEVFFNDNKIYNCSTADCYVTFIVESKSVYSMYVLRGSAIDVPEYAIDIIKNNFQLKIEKITK